MISSSGTNYYGSKPMKMRWTWDGVPPGTYEFALTLDGFEEPLYSVAGISIAPDTKTEDPRLKDIDLSKYLKEIRYTIHTSDGGKPEDVWVQILGDNHTTAGWNLKGSLFVPHGVHPDIGISAAGYRPWRQNAVSGDFEVTLQAALKVTLAVSPMPTDDRPLQLLVNPGEGHDFEGMHMQGMNWVTVPADGRLEVSLPAAGKFNLHWMLGEWGQGEVQQASTSIEVAESDGGRVLNTELPAALFEVQ